MIETIAEGRGLVRKARQTLVIGWRERVGLPDLGVAEMKAKIDTGARTSALHAGDVSPFDRDGEQWVSFLPIIADAPTSRRIEARLVDQRGIKNTSGVVDERLVIITQMRLGARQWPIEVSLANRESMEFDLILGRTALRRRAILVDPGKSFLAGPPVRR